MSDRRIFTAGSRRYVLADDWARLPETALWDDVCAVSIGPEDLVYVLCRGPRPLLVFTPDGTLAAAPSAAGFAAVHGGLARPDGGWLIADEGAHSLTALSKAGQPLWRVGGDGPSDTGAERLPDIHATVNSVRRAAGPFNRPTGVAVASTGDVYVADGYGNARVHRFASSGDFLQSWGAPGAAAGQFRLPHGIHIDAHDRVWVADWGNGRLQRFDLDGRYRGAIEGLEGPADLATDSEGFMFVAEEEWRISVFDPRGDLVTRWDSKAEPAGARTFVAPHCIAVDSQGSLYVGEVAAAYRGISRGGRALQKFIREA